MDHKFRLSPIRFILLLSAIFSSCQNEKLQSGYAGEYFYLDSLLKMHIGILSQQAQELEKARQENGKFVGQNELLSMDSMDWVKELNILYEMDPNKPEYAGLFSEDKVRYKLGYERIWRLHPKSQLPLKELKVTIYNDGQIDEVKGMLTSENGDTRNTKWIFIEFWKNRLDKYQIIEGSKNILTGDSTSQVLTGLVGMKER